MNTNNNVYTVIYTAVIVVVVAAVLAFAAMSLKSRQVANVKAETLSQMMVAAGLGSKEELSASGNDAILTKYSESVQEAFTIGLDGEKNGELSTSKENIQLIDNLKPQNIGIKAGSAVTLPVYKFKSGVTVIPVYGAGLWGPVWGYLAFEADLKTISGAYFDHEGETPGLGAKIKDEPWFREQFVGKALDLSTPENAFNIVKGGAKATNEVDAITGATMTSRGLDGAIDVWIAAYAPYLSRAAVESASDCCADGNEEEADNAEKVEEN